MAGYSDTSLRLKIRNEEFQSAPLKHFQNASDQYSISLRKAKRQKSHNKKRQIHSSSDLSILPLSIQTLLLEPLPRSTIFASIFSLPSPPYTQQEILRGLQQILSPKLRKEAGNEINSELVACLIQSLEHSSVEDCKIKLEILINCYYLYSSSIQNSLNNKSIEVFYNLLNGKNEEIVRNTVWLITNMVANDMKLKECLGKKGFGMLLVEIFSKLNEEKSISVLLWAMKIFFKEFSQFKGNWVLKLIQRIKHTLRYCQEKSLKIAISILYYIGNKNSEFVDCFLNFGIVSELFQYLKSDNINLTSSILNLLNLISSSENEYHTQVLLDLNILSELSVLSASEHPTIRKLAFFGYSNIAAGTRPQRKLLINDYSFMIIFNGLLDPEYEVISEALACVTNIATIINDSEFEQLLELGVFSKVEKLIKYNSDVFNYFGREILAVVDKLLRKANSAQMNVVMQTGLEAAIDTLILNENCSELAMRLIDLHFKDKKTEFFNVKTFEF